MVLVSTKLESGGSGYGYPWSINPLLIFTWFLFSLLVKMAMKDEKRWVFVNLVAVISFLALAICAMLRGTIDVRNLDPIIFAMGIFWIFGGFLTDLLDLVNYFWPYSSKKEGATQT
jgi:hypothetical protein